MNNFWSILWLFDGCLSNIAGLVRNVPCEYERLSD